MGRPRDPSRDAAILTATLELLGEVGYEKVTVRAIAQRSGTGLATIYRRWPTKEDLVVEAVAHYESFPHDELEAEDEPVDALVRMAGWLASLLQGPLRGLIPNILGQLPIDARLGATLRAHVAEPRLELIASKLRTVPGVDPDRVEEAAKVIPAFLFFQIVVLGRQVDDDDVRRVVDTALRAAQA